MAERGQNLLTSPAGLLNEVVGKRRSQPDHKLSLLTVKDLPFANVPGFVGGEPPEFVNGLIQRFRYDGAMSGENLTQSGLRLSRHVLGDTFERGHRVLDGPGRIGLGPSGDVLQ